MSERVKGFGFDRDFSKLPAFREGDAEYPYREGC